MRRFSQAVLLEREDDCSIDTEEEVCSDYEEAVPDTCYRTIPKERYDCPHFVMKKVCDFVHVYPVGETLEEKDAFPLRETPAEQGLLGGIANPKEQADGGEGSAASRALFIHK